MLPIEELRIGNYVTQKGSNFIESIDLDVLCRKDIILEPIPLNEYWLNKYGFIYNIETECYHSENNLILLNKKFILQDIDLTVKIKYVHQLQNLFFALTSKELEIKN